MLYKVLLGLMLFYVNAEASSNGEFFIRGDLKKFDNDIVILQDKGREIRLQRSVLERRLGKKFYLNKTIEVTISELEYEKK